MKVKLLKKFRKEALYKFRVRKDIKPYASDFFIVEAKKEDQHVSTLGIYKTFYK